ncbi:mCG145613 [Mus musculus]|nr:mCG145613 [Mus musculus]
MTDSLPEMPHWRHLTNEKQLHFSFSTSVFKSKDILIGSRLEVNCTTEQQAPVKLRKFLEDRWTIRSCFPAGGAVLRRCVALAGGGPGWRK